MSQPKITFEVSGMTCGSCARHVTSALTHLAGVAHVEVALRQGLVHVTPAADHASSPAWIADLVNAIDHAGYSATPKAS